MLPIETCATALQLPLIVEGVHCRDTPYDHVYNYNHYIDYEQVNGILCNYQYSIIMYMVTAALNTTGEHMIPDASIGAYAAVQNSFMEGRTLLMDSQEAEH